jgi:hypothetical protein
MHAFCLVLPSSFIMCALIQICVSSLCIFTTPLDPMLGVGESFVAQIISHAQPQAGVLPPLVPPVSLSCSSSCVAPLVVAKTLEEVGSHSVGISIAGCAAGKVGSVGWCTRHQSEGSASADQGVCKGWLTAGPSAGLLIKWTTFEAFDGIAPGSKVVC